MQAGNGTDGTGAGGHEAIAVVDQQMAMRGLRAARRHLLRRPETRTMVLGAIVLLWAPTVLTELTGPGLTATLLASSVLVLAVVTVACPLIALGMVRLYANAAVARDFAPGQLVGVVVGPRTLRIRGHHCSHEVSYDLIRSVEEHGGIVVVGMPGRYWLLPAEVLDASALESLRQRVGRRPHQVTLLPA